MDCVVCKPRERWEMAFIAQPEEVAVVRRRVRAHLDGWGLGELIDPAELCVSELVSNVVLHVGRGTLVGLSASVVGNRLRVEVRDPASHALPALVGASSEAEAGRGMTLVDALTDRWGVRMDLDGKVTWFELEGVLSSDEHGLGTGAGRILDVYSPGERTSRLSRLRAMAAEVAAIDIIIAQLHWMRAQGRDADDVLDRAQSRFEAQLHGTSGSW